MTTDDQPLMTDDRRLTTADRRPGGVAWLPTVVAGRWWLVALSIVLLLGAALRLYRLDGQRLWVDELYTADLVRAGLGTIWNNAGFDHTLPLTNSLFWLSGHIGPLSTLNLRLVSAVAAIAALALYQCYVALVVDRWTALLATGLLAIAPLAVYYAQEARPYALPLLGQMLTLLAFARLRRRAGPGDWALYIAIALLAVQLQYINLLPIGAQLLALLLLAQDRRRVLLGGALTVLATGASLAPFMRGGAAEIAHWQDWPAKLELLSTMQTMAAGDARIAGADARIAALAALAIGAALAPLDRRAWPALLVHYLQAGLALLAVFVLLPLAGRPVPAQDERQFLMLLPSVLLCFSVGVRWLSRRTYGWLPAAALCLALCITSAAGLAHYFGDFVKSPEALLADTLAAHARPGDVALSDGYAYSVDGAMRFYHPDVPLYSFRGEQDRRWLFVSNGSLLLGRWMSGDRTYLEPILTHRRIWLITRDGNPHPFLDQLLQQYQAGETYVVAPFRAQLLERTR